MGLLEDAIREHLDLKRKHGVPEQELERQEVEALGPARREQPPADDAIVAEADVDASADAVAADDAGVEASADALPAENPSGEALADVFPAEEADVPPHSEAPLGEPPVEPLPPHEAPPTAPEPEATEEPVVDTPPVEESPEAIDQPTELFDVDDALADDETLPEEDEPRHGDTPQRGFPAQEEAAPEDYDEEGDVLEDTPEFLQDAPEHDRLWFEQKPPRDFDFD